MSPRTRNRATRQPTVSRTLRWASPIAQVVTGVSAATPVAKGPPKLSKKPSKVTKRAPKSTKKATKLSTARPIELLSALPETIEVNSSPPQAPPSSPILPSSPVPGPSYPMDIDYTLRVNKAIAVRDSGVTDRALFLSWEMETVVNNMLKSPLAELEGREYRVLGHTVMFRVQPKGMWKSLTLEDLSLEAGERMISAVDRQVKLNKVCQKVEFKVETRVDVPVKKKAFPCGHHFNESSDPPTPVANTRTNALLREQHAVENAERIFSHAESVSKLHDWWICHEPLCDSRRKWCWVNRLSGEHFEIRACDADVWGNRLLEGITGVSVNQPPPEMVEMWRTTTGNKLRVDKYTKRRRHDGSDSGDELKRLKREVEESQLRAQLQKVIDAQEDREERRELMRRQFQQPQFSHPQFSIPQQPYMLPTYPPQPLAAYPSLLLPLSLPQLLPTQPTTKTAPNRLSSSPVAGRGNKDTRGVVRQFFEWVIAQQDEEDFDEYCRARDVAIDQRWTIEDLREMSDPVGGLRNIAVQEFKLKDGIVRHFAKDIRRFKVPYRAAASLNALAIG